MSDQRPIGVFDSGVGGLTVAAALSSRLPEETILYLGDTARLPYGTKSRATVERYTQRNVDFLVERGVKAVVVACNTASALALDSLRCPVPTRGVIEPGARSAVAVSRGRVGVVATESTIRSRAYTQALCRLAPQLEVLTQACPLLVPLVEEGWLEDPITDQVLHRYLEPLIHGKVDTVVLGCTHYPLLKDAFRRHLGDAVRLVDSATAVADEVAIDLAEREMLASGRVERDHVCVTDAAERIRRLATTILHRDVQLELVDLGTAKEGSHG